MTSSPRITTRRSHYGGDLRRRQLLPGLNLLSQNAKLSNIVVVDENTITADVFVKPNTPTGAQDVFVFLFGTGAGVFSGATGVCAGAQLSGSVGLESPPFARSL
ncbi:MAG: hypothetical protein IPG06_24490 [Haliea sp.]|nr:hypothetical protein [Haliea sp.]